MPRKKEKQEWPFLKKRVYPSGQVRWIVDARTKDGGERKTFTLKTDAETYSQQQRAKRSSEGAAAFSFQPADRIDAEKTLELLKPIGRTLREAAEFFVKHIRVVQETKTVKELVEELLSTKERDGASSRYLKDLRSRLNILRMLSPKHELQSSQPPSWTIG